MRRQPPRRPVTSVPASPRLRRRHRRRRSRTSPTTTTSHWQSQLPRSVNRTAQVRPRRRPMASRLNQTRTSPSRRRQRRLRRPRRRRQRVRRLPLRRLRPRRRLRRPRLRARLLRTRKKRSTSGGTRPRRRTTAKSGLLWSTTAFFSHPSTRLFRRMSGCTTTASQSISPSRPRRLLGSSVPCCHRSTTSTIPSSKRTSSRTSRLS